MITVTLGDDLKFRLYDEEAQKYVKSLPKRGTDPEVYEREKAKLAALQKSINETVKQRKKLLFEDFLSGRSRDAEGWREAYLENPVLKGVARLIVWQQGDKTFTVSGDSLADSCGEEYALTRKKVLVAHPIEMTSSDVNAWRNYFAGKGLKQPFVQVWEKAVDGTTVRPDRYVGCPIPFYRFKGREAHGIGARKVSDGDGASITFAGCMAKVNWLNKSGHRYAEINDEFEIERFEFFRYTRQVNHIVAYLDRICIYPRIASNDMSVMAELDGCALEQLLDYIAVAAEGGATELGAALLNYKDEHFPEYGSVKSLLL